MENNGTIAKIPAVSESVTLALSTFLISMRVLIVGSGVAGLAAAIMAERSGHQVILVTKSDTVENSNSHFAQGGIAYTSKDDHTEKFIQDILNATAGLALPSMVRFVAKRGPEILKEFLIDLIGVPFSRSKTDLGEFELTAEGAHSVKRILFSQDATGRAIVSALKEYLIKKSKVKLLTGHSVVDLITVPHHSTDPLAVYSQPFCLGAYLLKNKEGTIHRQFADRTLLATGGIGQLFRYNTNSSGATGDGIAFAYRGGARIVNLEFTQFHPTTLARKGANNFLISEAVRGEGGVLVNHCGEDFIKKVDPRGSLAPRDVVSRAIINELDMSGEDNVFLSLEKIAPEVVEKRFPNIVKVCREHRVHIPKEPIPVLPAFHFSCGGILTNRWGQTSLPNLYALGETACTGLHGANRLASTSLLECIVMAHQAVHASGERDRSILASEKNIREWETVKKSMSSDPILLKQDWNTLQSTLWNYVGIVRKTKRMVRALHDLNQLKAQVDAFYRNEPVELPILELRNALQTAVLLTSAALKNKKSTGCHYRVE